jgi:hypothetical protein
VSSDEGTQSYEPVDSLDAAWAEAEAALPDGWHLNVDSGGADGPRAHACPEVMGTAVFVDADADTPAAALRALAARLSETQP